MTDPAARLVEAIRSLQASVEEQNRIIQNMTEALATTHERLQFLEGLAVDHEKRLKALESER